jgi:hypothetical protein
MTNENNTQTPQDARLASAKSAITVIVSTAGTLRRSLRVFAIATTVSALWLWGWTLWPFAFAHWWSIVLAVLFLVLLLAPAAVLWLFVAGLVQLAGLPAELRGKTEDGKELLASVRTNLVGDAPDSAGRRTLRIGRSAYALWSLVLNSKGLLLQYAGLVRLANPFSLVIGLAAIATSTLLIVTALATSVWWLLFRVGG